MENKSRPARPILIFVYNADSGLFNTLTDVAHKIFSPQTYPCHLCALTHTAVGMRKEWKQFLDDLGGPLEFLHADELKARYGMQEVPLPAIFQRNGGHIEVSIDADSINACRTLDDLKRLILDRHNVR